MFGFTNFYGFFSGFTFRSLSRYSYYDNAVQSSPTETSDPLSGSRVEDRQPAITETAPSTDESTQPKDTIELSNTSPDAPVKDAPVVYTPETVAGNAPQTPTPSAEEPSEDPNGGLTAVETSTKAKFNLNMIFNLSEFEQTLATFAEDAEDGQVNIADYTELNIGLHSDLKMKVHQRELYKVEEGMEGAPSELRYREKGRFTGLGAALLKSRDFEAGLFYKESLKTRFNLTQSYEDGFLRVSRKMSLKYTQDFRFSLRSLNLYNTQAGALDQSGNLSNYLSSAEALVDSPQTSGDLLNRFFETVQGYLDGAEEQLVGKIESFFDSMADQMGLDSSIFETARDTLVSSIESFFDRVDSAVGSATARYIPSSEQPELPAPQVIPDPAQPELQEEAVAAAEA